MSDPTFSGDIMATAIADAILEALQESHWLNEVQLFIRGASPLPVAQDQYPFVEVIIGAEQFDAELSGGYTERSYTGLITVAEQITKTAAADWLEQSRDAPRQSSVTSYDTIKRLIMLIQVILGQEQYHDFDGLRAAWEVTHAYQVSPDGMTVIETFSVTEIVTRFFLAGPIIYGVEERPNNWENAGSIAFVVETQRAPVVYTPGA